MKSLRKIPLCKIVIAFALAISMLPSGTLRAQEAAEDPNWGHKQVAVDPKIYDGYAGRYQLTPDLVVRVFRDGDHLYAQATGQDRFELFPSSEKEYFAKVGHIEVSFITDDHGIASEFVFHRGARNTSAKRIAELTAAALQAQCELIEAIAAADFSKQKLGSVTIGVVYKNQLSCTKTYGAADMEKKLPADKDTVYRIGSITKMFTAVMLEQLVESGKVHLSDPVEKYFPEIKMVQGRFPDAPPITLIQLATHTSGLDREPGDTDTYLHGPVSDWEKTLIAALPHTRYAFEPGTRFSYSNIGFAILGAALSRAAGEPYVEYVPKHIFQPLGMAHTALELTPEMRAHLSKGYDVDDAGKPDPADALRDHETGRGYKVPNGAIYTTVGDMARFSSFLLGEGPDNVLKIATLDGNLTHLAVQANFQLTQGYTLGGMLLRRDSYTAFGHGGAVAGYQAALYMNRDASLAVIVLANTLGGDIDTQSLSLKSLDMLSKPQ
jgi:D-alanyl-D-alanine carboxypeptidase